MVPVAHPSQVGERCMNIGWERLRHVYHHSAGIGSTSKFSPMMTSHDTIARRRKRRLLRLAVVPRMATAGVEAAAAGRTNGRGHIAFEDDREAEYRFMWWMLRDRCPVFRTTDKSKHFTPSVDGHRRSTDGPHISHSGRIPLVWPYFPGLAVFPRSLAVSPRFWPYLPYNMAVFEIKVAVNVG